MALNINGTTGISGVDGSASAASIAGTDANTGLSFASDTVNINTGGVTRTSIDSAGRVGIGTTSPSHKLHVVSSDTDTAFFKGRFVRIDGAAASDSPRLNLSLDGTDKSSIMLNRTDSSLSIGTSTAAPVVFQINSTEHMRLDSSGRLLIGTSTENFAKVCLKVNAGNEQPFSINDSGNNSSLTSRIGFRTGNTQVGTIKSNQSSTQYNTSSDYRLKENAVAISDGITRIKTLKPYKFNWIVDETDTVIDGFFAHEVSNVVPEAISGTKDQIADSADVARGDAMKVGDPVYQQIDQSKLVPLLTAALQEAIAKIEVLETKVAALETS